MFVGLQGAGKTTTVAKFAHYYKNRRFKVAMVCADTFRAGAFDQLRQNASKLRVPFYGSHAETDPVRIAREGVAAFRKDKFDLIIVDTSGRHRQETELFREMEAVHSAVEPDDVVFVMDSTIGQAAEAQARAFSESVEVGSVVITKLDGHAKGGGALSAVTATGAPVIFTGSGEHFADLDPFEPAEFVGKLLGKGDLSGIVSLGRCAKPPAAPAWTAVIGRLVIRAMRETVDEGEQLAMLRRITKGHFTMRDLYEQLTQIGKLGPLSKVMASMPGPIAQAFAGMPEGGGQDKFKRMLVIMDSMTDAEMDMPFADLMAAEPRLRRVARGSGAPMAEVYQLMAMAKQFSGILGKFGKMGLMNGGDKKLATKLKRDPESLRRQLSAAGLPPSIMNTMGGVDGMMGMLKSLTGGGGGGLAEMMGGAGGPAGPAGAGGGMPDMASLMKMMGGAGGAAGGGMPDMASLMKMMGGAGGGMPGGGPGVSKRAMRKTGRR
ncbi:Srp54 [Symbiodinium sp. KB8]|nr:Srp54 [Symbiodinium sp. KB8]